LANSKCCSVNKELFAKRFEEIKNKYHYKYRYKEENLDIIFKDK